MRGLKFTATIGATFLIALIGATPAAAETHRSIVSGVEFYATSTQGRFAGTAQGQDANGLSGAWSIVVDHTTLDGCRYANQTCARVTGGSFSLAVTDPLEVVSGDFNWWGSAGQPDKIVLVDPGRKCTNQIFWITDGLHAVGTSSRHGTGSFTAYLTHYRHSIFGQCLTYSATVQGTVVLDF
ncbi:MAG: hypothetical protein M3075_11700 [Candidatus Dormibacteraeota bacterium]|nr:hypothetical protein [Candidatus Dormibacteraeota bacterium]